MSAPYRNTIVKKNVGISEMGIKIPESFIKVESIARERKLPLEYVNGGLGLRQARIPYKLTLEELVLHALRQIDCRRIERFFIATESDYDISKAVLGVATVNRNLNTTQVPFQIKFACLAGVQALLLAGEYCAATGKPAVVIVADRSIYADKKAEVTQGAGAVALRIDVNPKILSLDFTRYGQYAEDIDDFRVPARTAPLPQVNGPLTKPAYIKCLVQAFEDYKLKYHKAGSILEETDYFALHTPFPKMVVWTAAALWRYENSGGKELVSLLKRCLDQPRIFNEFKKLIDETREDKKFMKFFRQKFEPALRYNSYVGNCYNVSIFLSLAAALEKARKGEKIFLMGYGSGAGSIALMADAVKEGFDSGLAKQIKSGKELSENQYRKWKSEAVKKIRKL